MERGSARSSTADSTRCRSLEPRQPVHHAVDALGRGAALVVAEEMCHEEAHLGVGHDARAHRGPAAPQGEAGDAARRGAVGEAPSGADGVEVDVPALLAHDPAQQLRQHGVPRLGGQPAVAGLGGPFVDRTPRHVDGHDVRRQRRGDGEDHGPQGVAPGQAPAGGGQAAPAGGLVVGLQDLGDGLAVPVLLVAPARQEGGDLGIAVGPGGEQVAQVAGGVPLHVVHVAQAPQGVGVERVAGGRPRSRCRRPRGGPTAGSGSRYRWSRLLFGARPRGGCVHRANGRDGPRGTSRSGRPEDRAVAPGP